MKFFSGFCFENEEELFKPWLVDGDTVVAGFSKGAIDAFEYAYKTNKRVDRLILLSPAFFQYQKESFKKLQIQAFQRDKESYIKNFYSLCIGDSNIDISLFKRDGDIEELEYLLYYKWSKKRLKDLRDRGVVIEIFVGANDKIVDSSEILNFFQSLSHIWYIKSVGHILR